jgi:MFS family permease
MNLPASDFLSAPFWLLTTLHLVTLTLHLAAMNLLVGGIAIVLWGKIQDRWEHPVVRTALKALPSIVAATVTLGVAPLLFLQVVYGSVFYAASVTSGVFWLSVIGAVIVAYLCLYGAALGSGGGRTKDRLLSVAFVSLLFVSIVYASVFAMAERPQTLGQVYARNTSGFVIYPVLGDWIFRWLHVLLGAMTVGGLFFAWLGREHEETYQAGKAFFLWGMIGAALAGLGQIALLDEHLLPFMHSPAIWVLTVAVLLSLGSMHFVFRRRFGPAIAMILASLLGMVFTRHTLRLIKLEGLFDPSALRVEAQWGLIGLFLLCFAAMGVLLVWMARLYLRPATPGDGDAPTEAQAEDTT